MRVRRPWPSWLAAWLVVGAVQRDSVPVFAGLAPVDAVLRVDFRAHDDGGDRSSPTSRASTYDRAFFLWRAMTQWFGGLGVIALFVVVLPRLGIAGRQLFFAEASGARRARASARRSGDSARKLWMLYSGADRPSSPVLLMVSGLSTVYNGIVHALTTMSAGRLLTQRRARSMGFHECATAEWILVIFMVLSGTSFPLQWKAFFVRSPRARSSGTASSSSYVGVMAIAAFVLALHARPVASPTWTTLRDGSFQVAERRPRRPATRAVDYVNVPSWSFDDQGAPSW